MKWKYDCDAPESSHVKKNIQRFLLFNLMCIVCVLVVFLNSTDPFDFLEGWHWFFDLFEISPIRIVLFLSPFGVLPLFEHSTEIHTAGIYWKYVENSLILCIIWLNMDIFIYRIRKVAFQPNPLHGNWWRRSYICLHRWVWSFWCKGWLCCIRLQFGTYICHLQ